MKEVVRLLLNAGFKECMDKLSEMQCDSGFGPVDILHDLCAWVIKLQLPNPVAANLLEAWANLELTQRYAMQLAFHSVPHCSESPWTGSCWPSGKSTSFSGPIAKH